MSRIGKLPVEIPSGVEIKIENNVVTAKGPLGTEVVTVVPEISVAVEDNHDFLRRSSDDRKIRALHGLSRALVHNAVVGVKEGFTKKLEIQGVGYRAAKEGNNLNLQLGYSHPVKIEPPKGIEITVEGNTKITVDKCSIFFLPEQIIAGKPVDKANPDGLRLPTQSTMLLL